MKSKLIGKFLFLSILLAVTFVFGPVNYALAAPVTTISLSGTPGDNDWYLSNVTVTLAATDTISGVARIEYSFDNFFTWQTYSSPFIISSEGITRVWARAWDNDGNPESPVSKYVMIDRTMPVTTIWLSGGQLGNNGWYVSDVTVTLTAADTVSGTGATPIQYSLNGGSNWLSYDGLALNISNEGINAILSRIRDNAGILQSPPTSQDVKIDKTPLIVTIASNPTDKEKVEKAAEEPKVKVLNDNSKGEANNSSTK